MANPPDVALAAVGRTVSEVISGQTIGIEGDATTFNLRVRTSTVAAQEQGLTIKQPVAQELQAIGVSVETADLEDPTPARKVVGA